MHDLPSALLPMVDRGKPQPSLHCRMIRFHSVKRLSQWAIAKSPLTMMLRSRDSIPKESQSRQAPPKCGARHLHHWFGTAASHRKNNIWVVIGHDAVDIFSADGTCISAMSCRIWASSCVCGTGCQGGVSPDQLVFRINWSER